MATRILLADDHGIIRQGLKSLLEDSELYEIVGEASDGRQAVSLAGKLKPDIVIMDVAMPGLNGVEAARHITAESPGVKVVALSMHADRQYVGRMLEAGAAAYILKDGAFEQLTSAIDTVMSGRTYLCPQAAAVVVESYVRKPFDQEGTIAQLTPREKEVLQLLAEGNSTKETAYTLNVSVKTIETHRRNIMEKLDIHSVAELTKYAVRLGLTSLE